MLRGLDHWGVEPAENADYRDFTFACPAMRAAFQFSIATDSLRKPLGVHQESCTR